MQVGGFWLEELFELISLLFVEENMMYLLWYYTKNYIVL